MLSSVMFSHYLVVIVDSRRYPARLVLLDNQTTRWASRRPRP